MATPRAVVAPPQIDERGGARLTAVDGQGRQAIEQTIALELLGDGNTKHPWAQGRPGLRSAIFSDPTRQRVEIETRVREIFAKLEAAELARLVQVAVGAITGGQREVQIAWRSARMSAEQGPPYILKMQVPT